MRGMYTSGNKRHRFSNKLSSQFIFSFLKIIFYNDSNIPNSKVKYNLRIQIKIFFFFFKSNFIMLGFGEISELRLQALFFLADLTFIST